MHLTGLDGDKAPSFPTGNYLVELTWYFHQKNLVNMQLIKNPATF